MHFTKRVIGTVSTVSLCAILLLNVTSCSITAEDKNVAKGNALFQTNVEDFKKGLCEGTRIADRKGGEIEISKKDEKYLSNGVFTSRIIYTEAFQNLLLSCNADTPRGTSVKVEVQVMVDNKWSGWLNWGTWGAYIKSGSNISKMQDDIASMDEDVLFIKGGRKAAKAVRYKLTLNTTDKSVTPAVRNITMSLRNNINSIAKSESGSKAEDYSKLDKVLNVPQFSQITRDKPIAMDICSPTCIAMVLGFYGIDLQPEECAWGVYDHYAMLFGNWAFNCAYAGSYGFDAYTGYCDSIDDIKREIMDGYPVIASVRYKNSESIEGDLPVLHGAPIDKTAGHLVVVCGFTHEDGKEYLVVNDPAAENDNAVKVKYAEDEFEKAWFKVIYLIHGEKDASKAPRRQTAELVPTGNKRQSMIGNSYEYRVKSDNEEIDMSRNNIKTIMYTVDGENYQYITPASDKTFWFSNDAEYKKYSFLIISTDRRVFTADIK